MIFAWCVRAHGRPHCRVAVLPLPLQQRIVQIAGCKQATECFVRVVSIHHIFHVSHERRLIRVNDICTFRMSLAIRRTRCVENRELMSIWCTTSDQSCQLQHQRWPESASETRNRRRSSWEGNKWTQTTHKWKWQSDRASD